MFSPVATTSTVLIKSPVKHHPRERERETLFAGGTRSIHQKLFSCLSIFRPPKGKRLVQNIPFVVQTCPSTSIYSVPGPGSNQKGKQDHILSIISCPNNHHRSKDIQIALRYHTHMDYLYTHKPLLYTLCSHITNIHLPQFHLISCLATPTAGRPLIIQS